jgi:beta-phosphoglucomutase-like phosphatase (HAD superfamily)
MELSHHVQLPWQPFQFQHFRQEQLHHTTLPANFFQFSISADDVARTKPFPDPYIEAAQRLGVTTSSCVVFEDSLTGIASAKSAGCAVVAVPHYVEVALAPKVRVVTSLEDVSLEFLEEFHSAI